MDTPEPPDPFEQAQAQTGANITSATATQVMNNADQVTPYGSRDYQETGTRTIIDAEGNEYEVPTYQIVDSLSPNQQQILTLGEQTNIGLLGTANERAQYLQDYLPAGIDMSGMPDWTGPVTSPTLDTRPLTYQQQQAYGGPAADVAYGYNQVAAPTAQAMNGNVSLNSDFSGIGKGGNVGGGSMKVQQANGDIAGAGQGIQGSVNLTTQGGQTGGIQQSVNQGQANTNVNYNGPGVQQGVNVKQYQGDIADAGSIQKQMPVDDYSADRTRVEDAIMSRYNRQFEQTEAALDQKLRNQGLMPGTEAYDRQFRQMREMQTDASMQAILAGGQEQSRLFGLDLASGQFANAAQQQQFSQNEARGLFGLNVNNANNAAALAQGNFANSAQNQAYQQALASGQFQQQGTAMNNAAALAQGNFANAAQQQNYAQTMANQQFANQANLDMGNFANAAQAQRFGQMEAQTQARLAATQANNQGAYQAGSLANQSAATQAQYNAQMQQIQLAAQQASNQALMDQAQFANNAAQQNFANQMTTANFQQQQAADAAAFWNAAQGVDYSQGMGTADFNNAVMSRNDTNAIAAQNAYNQNLLQQYGLDVSQVNAQNELRKAMLQQEFALRNQPINEITALMSGTQVTNPQFNAPTQVGVAAAPIGQYMQDAYESELAASNAQASGLFGILSAGLGALPFSDRRLKTDIERIGAMNGIPVYRYKMRWSGEEQIGVMADEVDHIPGAVIELGGLKTVDYGKVVAYAG